MKKLSLLIASIFILLALASCGSPDYSKPLDTYFDAIEDKNAEKYFRAYADPYLLPYLIASDPENLKNDSDVLDFMNTLVKEKSDDFVSRIGKNFKFDYRIDRTRTFHEEDVKFLAKYLDEKLYCEEGALEDVMVLFVDYRANGDRTSEKIIGEEFVVLKIGGDWHVCYLLNSLDEVKEAIDSIALR